MSSYKSRHGLDWPVEMSDILIDLTIGKKWRQIEEVYGIKIKDPWEAMLAGAKALVPPENFKVSPWTEQHFHDFVLYDKLITWGCASSSKALLLDETIYFEDRVGTMREAEVGKRVLSATGAPAEIVAIHDQVDAPLYKVTFGDGTETVCSEDHLWTMRFWGVVKREKRDGKKRNVMGFVERTSPAKDLAKRSKLWFKNARVSVPLTAPVEFKKKDLPIDPYVLGCLLGDGSLCGACISFTAGEKDTATVDEMRKRLVDGYELKAIGGSRTGYILVKEDKTKSRNIYREALSNLGLAVGSGEKFIPNQYLLSSVQDRIDLLAGLLDTDGTISKGGHITFTSVSEKLADGVKSLVQSLGGVATVKTYEAGYKDTEGRYRRCKDAHVVRVSGLQYEVEKQVFKLPRKIDRVKEIKRRRGYKSIVSVELITDREAYPRETRCITLAEHDVRGNKVNGLFPIGNFTVTHNSNDTALLLLLDWIVDPYDTVTLLGSTTKEDLKSRSWEAVERYHHAIKGNTKGFVIPGRISKQGQKLINTDEDDIASSSGEKAGIQGRAINEGGRLQGAHAKYVRLVVDELAEISNHEAIKTAIANLRVGTISFKFIGLANPESWDNPSCQYCEPIDGRDSVNVDTGCWMSKFGCFVRHHDGLKSPCVLNPELRKEYPFLLSQEEYESVLRESGGNTDAPQIWKMIRGFPVPLGTAIPTILDPKLAEEQRVSEPLENADAYPVVGVAAGIDPAWSEGGDGAYRARVIVRNVNSKPILDFGGGLNRLTISATDSRPVTKQLRDQVIALMRRPGYEARLQHTAVDSSGNQGLADDLDIYMGGSCLHVNSSQRASDYPLRISDTRKAKEVLYDRGTEAWVVLAEFCRAGMVKGLPKEALDELTRRRYACRAGTTTQMHPLRMEGKDKLKLRIKKSPDEADACALAALAVKERLGITPFGYINEFDRSRINSNAFFGMEDRGDQDFIPMPDEGEYEDDFSGYEAYDPYE